MSDNMGTRHDQTQRVFPAQMVEPEFCRMNHQPITESLARIEARLKEWDSRLIGTPEQPGLLSQQAVTSNRLDALEASGASKASFWQLSISAAVGAVAAWLMGYIRIGDGK